MSSSIQTQVVRSKAVKLASTGDLIAAFCQGFSGRFGAKLSNLALVRLFSVLLSLAILSYANAALALLRQGDTGPEVSDLQNRLTSAQCYSGQITGYFGTLTLDAVMQCQRKLGVEADGIVGPRTLAALTGRSVPTNLATLQNGSSGSAVTELQRQLVSWGYDTGGIDGLFGGKTEAAVMVLQRSRGLAATGIVADRERQILAQQPTPATPVGQTVSRALTTGDSGTEVELLQRRLREQNYFDSPVTGYFGPITREAVVSFQAAQRLPATGVADTSTLAALGLARSNTQAYNPPAAGFAKGGFTTGSGAVQFTGISRYVVVIPKKSGATLGQVRGIVSNAFEDSSKLGDFIQTGAFVSQAAAEQQSRQLQAYGLDARVAYRQ
jgi:peptidoglycan hydrolase-like protein with peptidoglycan-binding domain